MSHSGTYQIVVVIDFPVAFEVVLILVHMHKVVCLHFGVLHGSPALLQGLPQVECIPANSFQIVMVGVMKKDNAGDDDVFIF